MTPRTPAPLLLIILVVVLTVSSLVSRQVTADLPTLRDNGDASRTVSWSMDTDQGLSLQDIELRDGRAELSWERRTIEWTQASDFAGNGSLDSNLSEDATGLVLRADAANHVADGNFSSEGRWSYENSATGNITAAWDPANQSVGFRHSSGSTQVLWDGLDVTTNWESTASPGSYVGIWESHSGQLEGAGMLGLNFTLPAVEGSYAAARRISAVDWSTYDRLVLWVRATDVSSPLTFNVTASVGTASRGTTAQLLGVGWQEIVVDLTELGPIRSNLQNVKLQINGRNVPSTKTVYFDGVRVANVKSFDEVARVNQTIVKANDTASALGSALFAFDWAVIDVSGAVRVETAVKLSGPSGVFERTLGGSRFGQWTPFRADVSATTSLAGSYDVAFSVHVLLDNTSASNVEVRVDNVSLFFPDRRNGTYLSYSMPLGVASEFVSLSWAAVVPSAASALLEMRSGNSSDPGSPTWSSWGEWSAPGQYAPTIPAALYFQVRAELGTTNASVSPTLQAFSLETRHRSATGSVVSGIFTASLDVPFLHWRTIHAEFKSTASASIAFFVGNGSYWTAAALDGNLSSLTEPSISWRAEFATSNGLETPELDRVDLVYEYLGEVTHVRITPSGTITVSSGDWIEFHAAAYDAGEHKIEGTLFQWWTDDPTGRILNNGSYQAGKPGLRNITAFVVGSAVSGTVSIDVREAIVPPTPPASPAELPILPYALLALATAGLAYVGYEIAIRRMFATEDVFIISREGRLILHNTRRLRADRDEDILAGMLTATVAFIRDSFREENGDLRSFEFAGKTILVERGEDIYVAAIHSGRVPRWAGRDLRAFVLDIEKRFGLDLAVWSGAAEDLPGLRELSDRFVSRARYHSWLRARAG